MENGCVIKLLHTVRPLRWRPETHHCFPVFEQRNVERIIQIATLGGTCVDSSRSVCPLWLLPFELVFEVLNFYLA